MRHGRILLWLTLTLTLGLGIGAWAQGKVYNWDRLDVDITVLPNGDMRIVETQQFTYVTGEFHYGYRNIPMNRLEQITDVEVWEGDRQYRPGHGADYTFETFTEEGDFVIKWYYPGYSNSTHTYKLKYTVKGGLRIYEGGDQVWWKAVFPDRSVPVGASVVTVHLPPGIAPDQIKAAAYGGGGEERADVEISTDESLVTFHAGTTYPHQELEVRVQFPHGLVSAQPPSWQRAEDAKREFQERWGPVLDLGMLGLGLLTLVGGPMALFAFWYVRGRDQPVKLVADYRTTPPSDLEPGVVGTLLDEKADMKDIIATIVDLARRGVISMEEELKETFLGLGSRRDFIFRRGEEPEHLRKHEKYLLRRLFGRRQTRRLSDLKNKFYQDIPELQKLLYQRVVEEGFFTGSPQRTRRIYTGLGVGALVLSVGIGIGLLVLLSEYTSLAICPSIGLVVTSIGLIILGRFMPRKTRKGAEAAAQWNAFKRYLANIEKYTDLQEAKEVFNDYLPYAIAFGLERGWIRKFAEVDAPAPPWYYPYPPIIYAGGGRRPGRQEEPVPGRLTAAPEGGGMPSLQQVSDRMAGSLQSMSDGLISLLNSSSSILRSAPSSSGGGGGGGGWSGGGGGGGGGVG